MERLWLGRVTPNDPAFNKLLEIRDALDHLAAMNRIARSVSLHPYFKVRPGQMAAVKSLLQEFVAKAQSEEKLLYYEFTINGDVVFCREAYVGAEGALAHLANVGPELDRMLQLCEVVRLEIHGPADELEKLKGPVGAFNPMWFAYECGVAR